MTGSIFIAVKGKCIKSWQTQKALHLCNFWNTLTLKEKTGKNTEKEDILKLDKAITPCLDESRHEKCIYDGWSWNYKTVWYKLQAQKN